MTTIYSADGQTVTRRYRDAPRWHWVPTSDTTGRFVPADTSVGYFPLVETERPADTDEGTHVYSVVRDGDRFVELWTPRAWTDDEQAARRQSEAPDVVDVIAAKLVAADNDNPQPWVQPTGAHDAHLPGAVVTDGVDGDRWRNILPVPNVWALTGPHAYGWENLDATEPNGPQPWVQPTGAHDAYRLGDQVTHNGQTWESTNDANVWAPPTLWVVVA